MPLIFTQFSHVQEFVEFLSYNQKLSMLVVLTLFACLVITVDYRKDMEALQKGE